MPSWQKGGHAESSAEDVADYFHSPGRKVWLNHSRVAGEFRGTGCYLATSIACSLASGAEKLSDAALQGTVELLDALAGSTILGTKKILQSTGQPTELPTLEPSQLTLKSAAAAMDERIGVYVVAPNIEWLKRLVPLGLKTVQLRIKEEPLPLVQQQVSAAVKFCRDHDCRLFINDYWQLAIEAGAYGVHLGQEDLGSADLAAIHASGLRLGISTHSLWELARAHSAKPSYIALGPIFPTTCKSMAFGPQGIERIGEWRNLSPYPIVAIGGLTQTHIADCIAQGADGVAVISAITTAPNPEDALKSWLSIDEQLANPITQRGL